MKILIIAYSYYPEMTPRSFRWSALAEEFVEKGFQVDVVTSNNNQLNSEENFNGVQIYRTFNLIPVFKISSVIVNESPTNISITLFQKIKNKTYKSLMILINFFYKKFIKSFYWPDSNFLWYFPALNLSKKLINLNKYKNIITVTHPYTCNLIGLSLKKKYPKINWITDNGDPFCFSDSSIDVNNKFLYDKINFKIENKVFKYADSVSYTNNITCNMYAEKFQQYSSKIILIPPLVKNNKNYKFVNTDEYFINNNNKIILSFFGVLYKGIRNPKKLLDLINYIFLNDIDTYKKIELHFFGDYKQCVNDFKEFKSISENIFFHNMVDKKTAISAMTKSDILINIGNNTTYQLPSKVVEYVSLMKPILNVCSIKNDLSAAYLKEINFVHSYYNNKKLAYNFIKNYRQVNFNRALVKKFENLHSTEVIANSYLKVLNIN